MSDEKIEYIQWYPGHMAKAKREIKEKMKLINVVIEVVDARLPISSKNPDINEYTWNKQHILLMNKSDLADPFVSEAWMDWFKGNTNIQHVMLYDAFDRRLKAELIKLIHSLNVKNKFQMKCLVCGIPNAGKSTVINSLIGKKKTQIGNRPGVTRGQQWLSTPDNLMLLDTPGILWPKFDDPMVGLHLAWLGSIKDTIYEKENIAADLLKYLIAYYPKYVENIYKITLENKNFVEIYDAIAKSRGLLIKGGEYDYSRTSELILNDFKNGRIGRITLERPTSKTFMG
ncbi:ribosome biogenesis GTPase YlqF [Acetobacterium bakii]|uniref:Ribosome biogenesis GTPase A n=1 Tax=Acetobacterium bakii TaxID=52689 RepID=A0A0L6TZM5_9FIRM|nr:ribosome biogenesis GTPase YlqF [Acetobacterium bakii]KNZ41532.1 ribosome biogenesis GTP-binding protein [Acetobacterium bakii]